MKVCIRLLWISAALAAAVVVGQSVQPAVAAPVSDCLIPMPHSSGDAVIPLARGHLIPR
jgi:hypothetical protein